MSQNATQTEFAFGEMLGHSWEIFQRHAAAFVIATAVFGGVFLAASAAGGVAGVVMIAVLGEMLGSLASQVVSMAVSAAVGGPLLVGMYGMARNALAGRAVAWTDLFAGFDLFVPAAIASFLVSLFTGIGILLCVLPGLFAALVYLPTFQILGLRRGDAWAAMEESRQLVMGNLAQWAIVFLLCALLGVAGSLLCLVGLLVTFPMMVLLVAQAHAQETGDAAPPLPEA